MLDFIYCFDSNYLRQAMTSIYSLLDNVSEPINIHIITNIDKEKIQIPEQILFHQSLNESSVYQINLSNLELYNLKSAHVTEATFYRLFLEDHINLNGYATYLDCDILCLRDPVKLIKQIYNKLEQNNLPVSFNTEIKRGQGYDYFEKLDLKGSRYFNAGVMVFNLTSWKKFKVKFSAIDLISILKDKALFWDQDILNVIFDEKFYELPVELNSRSRFDEKYDKNIIFHHFSGKYKPWTVRGISQKNSSLFHKMYQKIYGQKYLISVSNNKNALKQIIEEISTSKLKLNKKGLEILFYAFMGILRNIKKNG